MQANRKVVLALIAGAVLGVSVLGHNKLVFGQKTDEECPCIAEEYRSDKAYPVYKQAALDWRARKWGNALVKYHQVIEEYPSSPLAAKSHIGIGLHHKYLKHYDEAIAEFQKGIAMIPQTRSARDAQTSVACIYNAQGKYDDALNLLREVFSEAKDWDEVKYCSYWLKETLRRKAHQDTALQSCGPKALATIFRLKGIDVSMPELSSLFRSKNNGTSLKELKKAAKAKGLKAKGVKLNLAQLKACEMPIIALLKPRHYVVISSAGRRGFEVIDPSRGERQFMLSETSLQQSWTGYVLLFTNSTSPKLRYTLLDKKAMENTFGGVCDCCPTGDNGPPEETPGAEHDDPPSILVNMVNLNLLVQDVDLSYSGLGPDVKIKRTYNADDPREGPFGRSWTHSYNIYLTEEPSGDVLVNRGGGKVDRFYYVGSLSDGMSGVWNVNFLCTSTTCPDWSDVGDTGNVQMLITQAGSSLTAHMYDPCSNMTGNIDGNNFTLSGYWIEEEDEGCIVGNDIVIQGIVDGNLFTATFAFTLTPQPPTEPNCTESIGSGCEETFSTTGIRKVSNTGYITYEPGIYDTLVKNGDGSWSLKIKKDRTIQHFDPNGRLTSIVDRNGNALTFGYDGNGRLVSITDAASRVTTFTYDGDGHIIRITDPIGRNTSYTYDVNDNLKSSTDMAGCTTTYTYDQHSYMTAITTPKGTTTINNVYDEEYGYTVSSITDAMGYGRWYNIYWTSGEDDTMVTDALGNTTYYDNTDNGLTRAITDPLGNTTSFGYDIFGNRNSVTNANGNTTNMVYDAIGNITSITDPLGNVTSSTYDANDNIIQLKDALNRDYSYNYDANDNLTKVTDPLNSETNFAYDSHGQLTGITDARGNTTTFTYDANGNLISLTDPCDHTNSYTYDGVGRLLSRTDANGNTINYTYDGLGRVTEANYHDGKIIYNYDCCCSLTSVRDKLGRITSFNYDQLDRLTKVTYPDSLFVQYGYDAVGNRTSITYPPYNKTVRYRYDETNRLTRVTDWWNNSTVYSYDAAGNLVSSKCLPYNIITSYTYDSASRLISLETKRSDSSVICKYQYTLDAVGNRAALSATEPLEPNIPFRNISYTYSQDNQLLAANGTTFKYDNNGNLIEKKEDGNSITTFVYDYDNRLIQLSGPNNTYSYEYDVFGNRISKTGNLVEKKYIVDISKSLPDVLVETDESGNVQSYYIYGLGLISKIYDIWGSWEDNIAYYYYDGLGNTVALTDQSSDIINRYAYTPFGELAGIQEAEDTPNPFRYVGRYGVMDDENGLLYMRARYYDSQVGRFLSADPIGYSGGLNLYAYAGNNPINTIDPQGLSPINIYLQCLRREHAGWALSGSLQGGISACIRCWLIVAASGGAPVSAWNPCCGACAVAMVREAYIQAKCIGEAKRR